MIIKIANYRIRNAVFVLDFCFVYGLLSGYIEHLTIWRVALLAIFIMFELPDKNFRSVFNNKVLFLSIVSANLIFLNIVIEGIVDIKTLILNLLELFCPLILALMMVSALKEINPWNYFAKRIKMFNYWWIINVVVLIFQVNNYPIFIKDAWMIRSGYYEDLCSGLFGYNRVHVLSLFACFIMVMNFRFYNRITSCTKKRFFVVYTVLTGFIFLICSILNDNSAIFVIMPGCILYMLISRKAFDNFRIFSINSVKRILAIIIGGCVALGVLLSIPSVANYIYEHVIKRIERIVFINAQHVNVRGTNERLAIAQKAFQEGWGWHNGMGVGIWRWDKGGLIDFPSYGISSLGTLINQAGVWYFLLLVLIYMCILKKLDLRYQKEKINSIFLFAFILIMTIYTVLLTSEPHMILFVGIVVLATLNDNVKLRISNIEINENKEVLT